MFKTKCVFLCGVILVLLSNVALAGNPRYRLSFKIRGLHDSVCYMGCYYGDKNYIQDTARINGKGEFDFTGNKELPGGVYFVMLRNKKYFEFIVDKEQRFSMMTDTSDFVSSMKVKDSPENTFFYEYLEYVTKQHTKIEKYMKQNDRAGVDSINDEVKAYKSSFIKKHPDMFLAQVFKAAEEPVIPPAPKLPNGRIDSTFQFRYYKAHFFDNIDFSEGRLVRSPVLYPRLKEYLTRLTMQTPDSIIAASDYLVSKAKANKEMFKFIVSYITSTYEASNIMGMDAVFVHMAKKYYTPEMAYWVSASQLERIKERAAQLDPILVGKKCPEIVLPDTNNVMQALDSIRARYTIVYFWDYDCGYCQKETPKLIKWYDSVKGEGIQVYAVQLNEEKIQKWKDYVIQHKLDWINVSDVFHTSDVHRQFDIISTPIIYVLDENKRIIAKKIELDELNKVLRHDMQIQDNKQNPK